MARKRAIGGSDHGRQSGPVEPPPDTGVTDAAGEPRKSKSQLKRESHALQALGQSLTELSAGNLARMPLWPALEAAIAGARGLRRAALRRQIRYIARLLREGDAEPIERALESVHRPGRREAARHRRIERLRDALIGDDASLVRLREATPGLDFQHLRRLISAARLERANSRGSAAERSLFRYLRDCGVEEG